MDFLDGIGRRQIWTYAAAAAFYMFLSMAPFLCLLCALLPYTPLTEEYLLGIIHRVAPEELYSIFSSMISSIYRGSAATLSISAVASAWTASLSMLALMRGMDAAHDKQRRENFLVFRLRAIFFMVIGLAAVLLTLCALVYGSKILDLVSAKMEHSWALAALVAIVRIIRYPIVMTFLFLVFLVMYKWMPFGKRKLLRQWPGATFATVAWIAFSFIFSLYVEYSNSYSIYGILGTVIVALLWMYYILFILLVGSYINKFVREEPERLKKLAGVGNEPESEARPEEKAEERVEEKTEEKIEEKGEEKIEEKGDTE